MIVFSVVMTVLTTAWIVCLSDENTRADLKKLPTLPTKVLKEHPSLAYWYVPLNLSLLNSLTLITGLQSSSTHNDFTCRNWPQLVGNKWAHARYVFVNQSFIKEAICDIHLVTFPGNQILLRAALT